MVSNKVEIWIADVKAAFNQSIQHQRALPLYAWVPEGGIAGVDPQDQRHGGELSCWQHNKKD
eukprot:5976227-Amphidinium_carterae.1